MAASVQSRFSPRGVSHLVQGRGVILHTVLIHLLRCLADVELLLPRNDDDVLGWREVCTRHLFVVLDGTNPLLLLKHTVEGLAGKHSRRITQLRRGKQLSEGFHLVRLYLRQICLVDVEHVVCLQERNGLHLHPFRKAHFAVGFLGDFMSVLVPCHDVPVEHRHGRLTLLDMCPEVVGLFEGEIHRHGVATESRVQLEKERVASRISTPGHILRHGTWGGSTTYPSLVPANGLHLFHTLNHHLREPVYGFLTERLCISSSCSHSRSPPRFACPAYSVPPTPYRTPRYLHWDGCCVPCTTA